MLTCDQFVNVAICTQKRLRWKQYSCNICPEAFGVGKDALRLRVVIRLW
jgi:hypothetical protein